MAQEKWLVDGPRTLDIDNIARLKIGLVAGQVAIVGHDEAHVHVEVHSVSGKDLAITVDGDSLEIDHAQWRWDNFIEVFKSFRGTAKADISISVPREIALKLGVVSASAIVSGISSDASLDTVSGELVIDGMNGDVQLNSVGGEVSARNHRGTINANTVSADITAAGELNKFSCDTVSGDVFLDLVGIPDQVTVNTVSGSVTARLEEGVPVQYRLNTLSGRVQLDNSEFTGVRGGYSGKFGTLDRHWLEFRANTVSGHISVIHEVNA